MRKTSNSVNNVIIIFVFTLFAIPSVYAQERGKDIQINKLKQQIEKLEIQRQQEMEEIRKLMEERDTERQKEINALKSRIEELETAKPPEQREDLESTVKTVKEKVEPVLENLDIFGGFRLRVAEVDFNRQGDAADRYRARIRFRFGAQYTLLDKQIAVGARLSTGNKNDPRSPYVSFGNLFEDFDIFVDRAYLKYSPNFWQGLYAIGGKFGLTFNKKDIYNELVWDNDVQPEGVAVGFKGKSIGPLDKLTFTIGQYIVEEKNSRISWLTTPQITVSDSFAEGLFNISLGIGGFIYYGHDLIPNGDTELVTTPKNRGNAVLLDPVGNPVGFVSDFYILNSYIDLEYTAWSVPLIISGELIHNFGANIDQDTGFSVGAQLGKTKRTHDWRVYYQFQLIEQDSIFTPFSQDDFQIATNFWGHVAGIQYKIMKNMDVHIWVLLTKPDQIFGDLTDETNFRGRVDLTVSF
jgi:competence protein ComGC